MDTSSARPSITKKIAALLLAIALTIGLMPLPMAAFAENPAAATDLSTSGSAAFATGDKAKEPLNTTLTVNKKITNMGGSSTGAFFLGQDIEYEITVTNDGNATYENIKVDDPLTGKVWTIASLEPGASKTFTTKHIVVEADIIAGSVTNAVTAKADPIDDPDDPDNPKTPEGSDEVTTGDEDDPDGPTPPIDDPNPHLSVVKTVTSTPANGSTYGAGETITYNIVVKNTGNVTLKNINVSDTLTNITGSHPTLSPATIASLEPGANQTYTVSYTVLVSDAGATISNCAKATAVDPTDPAKTVTGTDTTPGEPVTPSTPIPTPEPEPTPTPEPAPAGSSITITAASSSKTYDGKPLTNNGYTYTQGVLAEGDVLIAVIEGTITNVGTQTNKVTSYKVMRGETDVTENYTFGESVDGELTINPLEVTVRIAGNVDATTYDGEEHKVEGYEVEDISYPLYTENDFTFSGEATAVRKDVGITNMGLNEDQFENINDNFDVTFSVGDGSIEITPLKIEVKIAGNTDTQTYNGEEQKVEGYKIEDISDPLYEEGDFYFSGKAVAKGTDAADDPYMMGLADTQFTNTNKNFDVTFVITSDGSLTISPADLTITAKNKTYAYDGNVHGPGDATYEDPAEIEKMVIVQELLPGDKLASIVVNGQSDLPEVKTYEGVLLPGNAVIENDDGKDVTGNYIIDYVNGNVTIATACDVTATIKPDESGWVSGAGPYEPNATVSLTATPNTGYRFVNWTSNDVSIADPTETTITFKMPSESVDVTANFEEKAKIAVTVTKDGTPQDSLANYLYLETKEGERLGVVFAYSTEDGKYIYDPVATQGDQLASGDYVLKLDPPASSGYAASSTGFSYYDDVAQISTTFQYFTVEFVNYDDTVLQSSAVAYRETPVYTGATPTKPATAQYIYEFAGWDPAIGEVTKKTTYKATFTEKEKGVYEVVSGAGSTWSEGSGESLVFVFKRTADDEVSFDNFKGILMDGKEVPKEDASGKVNYTVEKGSVIVSLQPAYAATLSEGEHTLTAVFDDGNDVDASFTVAAKSDGKSAVPATGDDAGMVVIPVAIVAGISLVVLIGSAVRRRAA